MWPLWEREIDLLATQRRTVLFAEMKETFSYELPSPLYYLQASCSFFFFFDFWSIWISLDAWSESTNLCRNLQNFKPLETGDVHSELLVFRLLWRLVLQSLQVLNTGDVHQNFYLQNLQALDQKHTLQRLGLVHQNFLSKVFRCIFGRSSEHAYADDLLIRATSSEFALNVLLLALCNFWLSDLLLLSQNLLKHSAHTLEYQNCSFYYNICYHQNLGMFTQNQLCSYNLPLFDDDKTMYFNEPILHKYLTDKNINISEVISEF